MAGDGGLREALEKMLARKVEQSNGVDTEWSTVTVRQLREVLAAHPAAPAAVPQPVDREALTQAVHHQFCLVRHEATHAPDQLDYDKADEILEILALLDGSEVKS